MSHSNSTPEEIIGSQEPNSTSIEDEPVGEKLELNIEEMPESLTVKKDASIDAADDLSRLLIYPNNIPCKGFHKEIIPNMDNPKHIHVYIYPPEAHKKIIIRALDDTKIKNKRQLTRYLAELKKEKIQLPEGCSKTTFGTFYTRASSLKGEDIKLLAAYKQQEEQGSPQSKSVSTDEGKDEEEEEELDDASFKKLDQELQKQFLDKFHPEIVQINFDELLALSRVVRDPNGKIIDSLHKTIPFLTKYEHTRILGIRSKQLNSGATPFITIPIDMINGYTIANQELKEKKIPFIIRRPIPNGASEYWKIEDLEIIH